MSPIKFIAVERIISFIFLTLFIVILHTDFMIIRTTLLVISTLIITIIMCIISIILIRAIYFTSMSPIKFIAVQRIITFFSIAMIIAILLFSDLEIIRTALLMINTLIIIFIRCIISIILIRAIYFTRQ